MKPEERLPNGGTSKKQRQIATIDPLGSFTGLLFQSRLPLRIRGAGLSLNADLSLNKDAIGKDGPASPAGEIPLTSSGNPTSSSGPHNGAPMPELSFAARLDTSKASGSDAQTLPTSPDSDRNPASPAGTNTGTPSKSSGETTPAAVQSGNEAFGQTQQDSEQQPDNPSRLRDNSSPASTDSFAGLRPAVAVAPRFQSESGQRSTNTAAPEQAPVAPADLTETREAAAQQKPKEIGLRLETGADSSVSVQLVERSGGVHVAVRTHDAELARSLQNNLNDLVGSLKKEGIGADAWIPPAPDVRHADTGSSGSRNEDGASGFGSGSGSQQRGQSGRRGSQDRGRRPQWVESLDENFFASFSS